MKLGLILATAFVGGCGLTAAQVASDVETILGAACTVAQNQPSDPSYVLVVCTIVGQLDGNGNPLPARTITVKGSKERLPAFLAANGGPDAGAP